MTSSLPPDPYAALGVPKDAETAQIKSAHRKLVLKFHPDRIKGDDIEEKEKAKHEFQKVQQAYELLVDASKRSKYDNEVRLAELVRERLLRGDSSRPSAQTSKSHSGTAFVRREVRRDGNMYEERAPPTSYFDDRDQFDEPLSRGPAARKHEVPHEKERKPSAPKTADKRERERTSSRTENPVDGISSRINSTLRAKAAQVKERSRDIHARDRETRDRDMRRERSEKHSNRRPPYPEVESDSDSDTEVPPRQPPRPTRSAHPGPEPVRVRRRPSPVRRGGYDDEDSYDDDEKWEHHHKRSMDYIAEAKKRPGMSRNDSDAYVYWHGDQPSGRRSGSDTERRPSSSRRTKPDDSRSRPAMPVHSSAPSNLRPHVEDRVPQRSQTNPYPPDRDPRPINLNRSQTMPVHRSSRKDTAPTRGSTLKQVETPQDSGYYSTSNPHTPEMKTESPPPSRENSKKKSSSTKYTIVQPESDDDTASRVNRFFESDDEVRPRRVRSPDRAHDRRDRERERRERERDRERDRDRDQLDRERVRERPTRTDSDGRPRPTRAAAPSSFPRAEFDRHPSSPRGSPPRDRNSRKLYGEFSGDERDLPRWKHDPASVKTASYRPPVTTAYPSPRIREPENDYFEGSRFREDIRYPGGRRSSAAH